MGRAAPYLRLLRAQIRSQTQYRASFVLDVASSALMSALDIAAVFVLFGVRGRLGGFDWPAVLLMTALSACAFPIADTFTGNLDRLRLHVRTGHFDALLLRPLSALGQLMVLDFQPRRIGRVVQGVLIYLLALTVAGVNWTPARVLLAVVAPVAGGAFFASLFIIGCTVVFWWVESGEMANVITYGGRDFTSYPMTVFDGLFRKLFAFGLGFAFVAYLPAIALLGLPEPLGTPAWLHWCSPLAALPAAAVAGLLWRAGIRHYRSTGS